MCRVIVCGGRKFGAISYQDSDGAPMPKELIRTRMAERKFQYAKLDELHKQYGFTYLAEGGADGADTTAFWWRKHRGVDGDTWHAKWKEQGKAAGSVRNQRMLFESNATLVIAFPGGSGTADMVAKAKRRNIQVIEVTYAPDND